LIWRRTSAPDGVIVKNTSKAVGIPILHRV
jgi:hypothetical protein